MARIITIPALIDPHVHFRTPGAEHKENWLTGAMAAFAGGVTTVFDMPNNSPSIIDKKTLLAKKETINEQISQSGFPLRYYLYLGATDDNFTEFKKCSDEIIGVKLFMGASTGSLLVSDLDCQKRIFAECARLGLVLAIHAEDENTILANKRNWTGDLNIQSHSQIRNYQVATNAIEKAIKLTREFGTKLYITHVSTVQELELIRTAKKTGLPVYCETTPHHLFLNTDDYGHLGTLGQMNPPLRAVEDNLALWEAINDGIIDTIGTDHAPHTLMEKKQPYGQAPSGVPGIETCLPLLINAYLEGKISLEKIIALTHTNIQDIFEIPAIDDTIQIDLDQTRIIKNENLKTKCQWSPFVGRELTGWPISVNIGKISFSLT